MQIWVFPKEQNITPRYEQKTFHPTNYHNVLQTVVAPDHADAVWINQDAWFSLGYLDTGIKTDYTIKKQGNGVYVFVIEGEITIEGQILGKRDALGIWDIEKIQIESTNNATLLLIDIPMEIN